MAEAEIDLSDNARVMAPGNEATPNVPASTDLSESARVLSGRTPPMGEAELERRMTPGPKPPITATSFQQVPSRDGGGGMPWNDYQPGGIIEPMKRVGTEMKETFQNTPAPFLPSATDYAEKNLGWVGRNILSPAMTGANYAAKGAAAAGAGITANLAELIAGGDPQKARDAHALLTIAPVLGTMVPPGVIGTGAPPRPGTQGDPNFVGPPAPVAKVLRTEAERDAYTGKLYESSKGSDFNLIPQFSKDWAARLDKYLDETPAGKAVQEKTNSVAALVSDLKNVSDAPMGNIRSIQEVEQRIQRAINKEWTPTGVTPEGRQMQQLLRDFRDSYENIPADQFTGSPQAIQDFTNARAAHAASKRIEMVQRVLDETEQHDNRPSAIRSRIRAITKDERNLRGWTDEEIASFKRAADNGMIREWMRTEGSRLLGIGTALGSGDWTTRALAVPVQAGVSYAMRDTLENLRLRDLQRTQTLLAKRIPQPGTVPAEPPSLPVPQLLTTGLRYSPLVGLLGQTQDQPRQ